MQKSNLDHLVVHADGGCLNNGNANGSGVVTCYGSFRVDAYGKDNAWELAKHQKLDFPEHHTVNEAEYDSLIQSLIYLRDLEARMNTKLNVLINIDSRLVFTQLAGTAKCKAPNLMGLYAQAHELLDSLGYDFHWISGDEMKVVLGH